MTRRNFGRDVASAAVSRRGLLQAGAGLVGGALLPLGSVMPVFGDDNGLGWRTRVRLAVDDTGRLGFRRHRSHELELVDYCPIACAEVMDTGTFTADWAGFEELEISVTPRGKVDREK